MAANPMYQFNVYRIGPEIKLGEVDISFTNASLFMVVSSLAILIIFNLNTLIFIMLLATACSKKLMPPEIGSSSERLESSDFSASSSPKDAGAFGDSGFLGSDSIGEEPINESGASLGGAFGQSDGGRVAENSDGPSSRNGNIGNGSSGSFESANPFLGGGSNGSRNGMGAGSGNGNQTANLNTDFQDSGDLKDIHFKFDKYDLDNDSRKVLQQNANILKENIFTINNIKRF